jgi:hypothetical protein
MLKPVLKRANLKRAAAHDGQLPALSLDSTGVICEFDSDIPPPIVIHAKQFEGCCHYSSQE